ncbi:hypothetical protein CMZ82_14825 [Lysobacteraceae bacterium NML93-0792]|nr:hypothetical protein CMZ82_14825 [Xanthomonadaceae bacterium NML93-0792]PBS14767.1 hypothetical protein CMZ81_14370 [Xanthomonadaceae bacterium NML93-0793]PBS17733.1 hypothetical protein CMZ80_15580 [Xanthomonadaceae bacterium NML93-0831]
MRPLLILMLLCAAFGAHQLWQKREAARAAAFDATHFVAVTMPDGMQGNTVYVLTPPNCPSHAAKRAETLIRDLENAGIPVVRGSGFSFNVEEPTPEQIQGIYRASAVFKRGPPTVFVNGLAMSDPSTVQAIAAYRGERGEAVRRATAASEVNLEQLSAP